MLGMILFGGVLGKALAQYEDSEDAAAEDSYGGGGGDGGYGGGGGGGYGGDGDEGYGGGGGGGGGADLSSHIDGVLDLDDKTWAKVRDLSFYTLVVIVAYIYAKLYARRMRSQTSCYTVIISCCSWERAVRQSLECEPRE